MFYNDECTFLSSYIVAKIVLLRVSKIITTRVHGFFLCVINKINFSKTLSMYFIIISRPTAGFRFPLTREFRS